MYTQHIFYLTIKLYLWITWQPLNFQKTIFSPKYSPLNICRKKSIAWFIDEIFQILHRKVPFEKNSFLNGIFVIISVCFCVYWVLFEIIFLSRSLAIALQPHICVVHSKVVYFYYSLWHTNWPKVFLWWINYWFSR